MTQRELSDASGLSERHIRNLEKGERYPKPDTIRKLCRGLNATIRDLFDFDYP
jgi:transcriptional regulator with XRE-family HTH domain